MSFTSICATGACRLSPEGIGVLLKLESDLLHIKP
jgi:hypothetical protein